MQFLSGGKMYHKSSRVQEFLNALQDEDVPARFIAAARKAFKDRTDMWHAPLQGAPSIFDRTVFLDVDMRDLQHAEPWELARDGIEQQSLTD